MNSSKDLFTVFREKESLLRETPPRRNWRRIERRLDRAQLNNRHSLGTKKPALWGTALVLTLAFSGMAALHLAKQGSLRFQKAAFTVEVLPPEPVDPTTGNLLEMSRSIQAQSFHIAEGEPGQELIVRP